jgi:hypothetical protein
MKRKIRKLITGAISATALISSVSFNAGAENVQPRGLWHVYGDVNNDGTIDLIDIININKAVNKYRELTGEEQLPMRIAVARPAIYFENTNNPVPQAADVNGDGYISLEDSDMVLRYVAEQREDIGRCGEHFYIS